MSNNKNINVHPALTPRNYVIIPYRFSRINNVSKSEVEENDNIVSIKPICVKSFSEIKNKVVEALNLHWTAKIAFKSVICPDFIRRDNAIMGDSEEDGMTGFYCEIDSVLRRGDDLYIAFPSIDREIFFHYVEVIESTRQLG